MEEENHHRNRTRAHNGRRGDWLTLSISEALAASVPRTGKGRLIRLIDTTTVSKPDPEARKNNRLWLHPWSKPAVGNRRPRPDAYDPGIPPREQVYEHLWAALIAGNTPAGTQLNDTDVAIRPGLSRTPVREAFREVVWDYSEQ